MALTEREKRLLAEMEAALASDDPALQSTLSTKLSNKRAPRLKAGLAASLLLIAAGIVILFAGLIAKLTFIGVAGFLVALFGTISALRALSGAVSRSAGRTQRGSMSATLNDRWQRRQEGA